MRKGVQRLQQKQLTGISKHRGAAGFDDGDGGKEGFRVPTARYKTFPRFCF